MKFVYSLLCFVLLSLVYRCNAVKILLLPANINSHVLYFARLADTLSQEGHVTNLLVPSNGQQVKSYRSSFTITRYPVKGDKPFMSTPRASQWLLQVALSKSALEQMQVMMKFAEDFLPDVESNCVSLFENKALLENIKREKYDFAIMDTVGMYCYDVLPYSLDIPYATLSVAWIGWFYRIPQFPSFASILGYTDRMTFTERLTTLLFELGNQLFVSSSTHYSQLYAPDKPALDQIQFLTRSSMWIIIEDLSLGYPRPTMPNTVSIGDLMAGQPVQPLPSDLQQFLNLSPNGVILVSFGSFFDFIPLDVAEKFCNVFNSLKYRVIWKIKSSGFCDNVVNVRKVLWMPQNDLLASEKVVLFITHAGLSSLAEALYHAKPLIAFPIALDQPSNAASAQAKGYGIRMDISDFTESELEDNINKILINPDYLAAAKHHSAIMKDKPSRPGERVSYLINHVLKFGDSHLRTGAYDLSIPQFFMMDLFAVIFSFCLVCFILICLCLRCTYRCVRNRCCKKSSVTEDKKLQ